MRAWWEQIENKIRKKDEEGEDEGDISLSFSRPHTHRCAHLSVSLSLKSTFQSTFPPQTIHQPLREMEGGILEGAEEREDTLMRKRDITFYSASRRQTNNGGAEEKLTFGLYRLH